MKKPSWLDYWPILLGLLVPTVTFWMGIQITQAETVMARKELLAADTAMQQQIQDHERRLRTLEATTTAMSSNIQWLVDWAKERKL